MRPARALNPQSLALYLRIAGGYTQRELAHISGLSCNDICRVEQGFLTLGIGKLIRLADALKVTPDALFNNDFSVLTNHSLPARRRNQNARKWLHQHQRRCEEIGDKGEKWVAQLEEEKLRGTPYEGLLNTGYAAEGKAHCDMLSFLPQTGQPVVIEVKTTTGEENEDLYFSEEELRLLRHCAAHHIPYELHRVYRVDDPACRGQRVYTAQETLEAFSIVPHHYIFQKKEGGTP